MARTEARIFAAIWQDDCFLSLPPTAQRLYLFLLSQPDLSYCGLIALRERRWARTSPALTEDGLRDDLKALAQAEPRPFLVVDEDTEEVFVRSLIRRDEIWKQPNLLKSAREAAKLIQSPTIRAALVQELKRIPIETSGSRLARTVLAGFLEDFGAQPQFPTDNPFAKGSTKPSAKGSANPVFEGGVGIFEADSANPTKPDSDDTSSESAHSEIATDQSAAINPSGNPSPNPSQGKGERGKGKSFKTVAPQGSFTSEASPSDPPSDPPPEPDIRDDTERLCQHLADRIEANGSPRPDIGKRWRDAARLLIDKDGRTEEQVRAAIDWCQDDEFWRANVLSMPTLREKYDQLRLQARRTPSAGRGRPAPSTHPSPAMARALALEEQMRHNGTPQGELTP